MLRWTVHLKRDENRSRGCAAVAVGNELYCFVGANERRKLYVEVFHTEALLWKELPPGRGQRPLEVPSWRCGHTAVLVRDIVYIWGGMTGQGFCCGKLYAFDVDAHTWSNPRVSGNVPTGTSRHSACVLGKVMFILGVPGHDVLDMKLTFQPAYIQTTDIYKLDTSTMVWTLIKTRGTAPPVLSSPSATTIGTKMFLFGGDPNTNRHSNIVTVFDTETNLFMKTPSTQPLPEGRRHHSAFTYNGELYIFGGEGREGNLNDLWKFNPETFSWKEYKPKGNGPLRMTDGCCCIVGDRIILFRGTWMDELFILDLSPSLKTLCKLAVIQYGLKSRLPHNIRWELAAMTSKSKRKHLKKH